MKAVIAIDSFKGNLSSRELSKSISLGIKKVFPEADVITMPVADGGEGTVEALISGSGGRFEECLVHGPLMEPVTVRYGILEDGRTAVIEMASASGLTLIPEKKRNPLKTTTLGTGELIRDAVSKGCRNFIIGIGGSATNDLGMGMMVALGAKFTDISGKELQGTGENMEKVANIDLSGMMPELEDCSFTVASDVNNPLYGHYGAAFVYAPQKGADRKDVRKLDAGLRSLADKIKNQLGKDISDIPGSGAAGGLGGAFIAFLNGKLVSGIDTILDALNFDHKISGADVVITGEGRIDSQSAMGKVVMGVAKRCKNKNIPVIVFAGDVSDDAADLHEHGITSLFSIMNYAMSVKEAMNSETTSKLIMKNTEEVFRLIKAFM